MRLPAEVDCKLDCVGHLIAHSDEIGLEVSLGTSHCGKVKAIYDASHDQVMACPCGPSLQAL
jgi:hypothetical protein